MKRRFVRMFLGGAAFLVAACGSGAMSSPSTTSADVHAYYFSCKLRGQVALVGLGDDYAVLLTPGDGQTLERRVVPVGQGAIIAKSSEDGRRLFVLSRGKEGGQGPSLTVVDVLDSQETASRQYVLPQAHSGMVIDPEGRWLALHTVLTQDYTGINVEVEAPPVVTGIPGETRNEILVVDLEAPPTTAVTSHVFDAPEVVPNRIWFSPTLHLPGATGRFLTVHTDHQVSILDLARVNASPPAAPIPVAAVNTTMDGGTPETTGPDLLYDDGDPTKDDDAQLVARFAGSPTVDVLTFAPHSPTSPEDSGETEGASAFQLVRSEVVADDVVSRFDIVTTTDGPRLAMLVPTANVIDLVDLNTASVTGRVSLPHPYLDWARLRREGLPDSFVLTNAVWSIAANSAAGIWSLEPTQDAPFGHVETVESLMEVDFELQVPSPHDELVLFRAGFYQGDPAYFVFNLQTGAATRVEAVGPEDPMVSADGRHLWFFAAPYNPDGSFRWAVETVNLEGLGADAPPAILDIEGNGPGGLFDLPRPGGGRVMVEVAGGVGLHLGVPIYSGRGLVTVFDGDKPDTSPPKTYRDLLNL